MSAPASGKTVPAAVAHPDDIERTTAGALPRQTERMFSKIRPGSSVPMPPPAGRPGVRFGFRRPAAGTCEAEMH